MNRQLLVSSLSDDNVLNYSTGLSHSKMYAGRLQD